MNEPSLAEAWAGFEARLILAQGYIDQAAIEDARTLVLAAQEETMDCLKDGFMGYYELRKKYEALGR